MIFEDRTEAGKKLADKVLKTHPDFLDNKNVIVLALPRGGVPAGYEISKKLQAPFNILVTHKLGYPGNEELAIGAVSEDGSFFIDPSYQNDVSNEYIMGEKKRQLQEIQSRIKRYRVGKQLPDCEGKMVIIVDDGIATGHTMRVAIKTAHAKRVAKILVAVPIIPKDTLKSLSKDAEMICLETPSGFLAIGQFYRVFGQPTDEEVRHYLTT